MLSNVVKTNSTQDQDFNISVSRRLETRTRSSLENHIIGFCLLFGGPVYIELNLKCELSCSNDFIQGVLKLMVGALAPYVPYLFKMKFVHKVHQVNDKKG